jgi:hypothetical protein
VVIKKVLVIIQREANPFPLREKVRMRGIKIMRFALFISPLTLPSPAEEGMLCFALNSDKVFIICIY